jgi:ABC-type nitrate/sulfonate/bicarbonate transport system substrate-binding protein
MRLLTCLGREEAEKMGLKVVADLAVKKIPYPHAGLISSQKMLEEKRDAMMRFGRATVEAIHYFKTNKPQTIAILKKYAKTDVTTLDTAHTYLKGAIPDLPYPTLEGMKTILAEMGRTRSEVLKTDPASMVDASIVKAIDDEGFLKKLK